MLPSCCISGCKRPASYYLERHRTEPTSEEPPCWKEFGFLCGTHFMFGLDVELMDGKQVAIRVRVVGKEDDR